MATTDTQSTLNPTMTELEAVEPGGGDHRLFLNHLASVKVSVGESATQMSAVEFTAPRGFGPPLHAHLEEDEIMYVLDGEMRVDLGEESRVVTKGAVVSLPHGTPTSSRCSVTRPGS